MHPGILWQWVLITCRCWLAFAAVHARPYWRLPATWLFSRNL